MTREISAGEAHGDGFSWLKCIDRFSVALAMAAGVACMLMMANIVFDVVGRAASRPLPGTVDITQFAWMPVVVSLGMGYALLAGQHIRVGLLTDPSTQRTQRVVEVAAMTATLATFAAFAWFGVERAIRSTQMGEASSVTPWLPIWLFRWVLVIGVVGLALQALAQLIRALTVPVFGSEESASAIGSAAGDPSATAAVKGITGKARP